jgi:hypothetical protein
MEPDSPYQLIEALGSSQVGSVWSAVDRGGRSLTVVVLDASVATDQRWRDAFVTAVNAMANTQTGGPQFLGSDYSAAAPWAAFAADGGPGAERVFLALGVEYQPVPPDLHDATAAPRVAPEVAQRPPEPTPSVTAVPPAEPHQPAESPEPAPPVPTNPWAAGPPRPASPPPDVVSGPPYPTSAGSPQPVSAPPEPMSVPPYPVSGTPVSSTPVSGSPMSVPPYPVSGSPMSVPPYPVSGSPRSPAVGPLPPAGPTSYSPYPPLPGRTPAGARRRRTGLLVGVAAVTALILAGGAAAAWQGLRGNDTPEQRPTGSPASAPVLSAPPLKPGLEPPIPGDWPAVWPKYGATSNVQTLSLDGVGFKLTIPSAWDCVLKESAEGSVRYNCGTSVGNNQELGGELIVRDCPKPCDEVRRTTMRASEDAWGLRWRNGGEYVTLAETLDLNGEQRYAIVLVGYRRSVPDGTVDRQVVLRLTGPVGWIDELRRAANSVRDAAVF